MKSEHVPAYIGLGLIVLLIAGFCLIVHNSNIDPIVEKDGYDDGLVHMSPPSGPIKVNGYVNGEVYYRIVIDKASGTRLLLVESGKGVVTLHALPAASSQAIPAGPE